MLLKEQWVIEEIRREIKKFLETEMTTQHIKIHEIRQKQFWGKFIEIIAYNKKLKRNN